MNERIEALKKLATKEVWGNNPYNGAPSFDGYELDADKFAELIVKECANLATIEYDKRGAINGVDLLEHFGVTE